jgi:predicted unusual protein kinase regulating ubiquinone biosynthesis (AarF/ABC1/UbiB family)
VPRELDFVNEGRNAERVAALLAAREDVGVPAVHWDLTTRRVLVMDFADGIKITDTGRLREAGIDVARVARTLVEVFCEQNLVHGFFHADPHPGNLLVQRTPDGAPRLVLLDFGLAKELPPDFRSGVVRFAAALLRGSADAMADALLALGFETRDGRRESMAALAALILDAAIQVQENSTLDRALAEKLGERIADAVRENPIVRMPSHVVLLGRVLGLLSGVNRSLEADLDLVRTILPYAFGDGP